ncbi:Neutral/alkaline non-lysosomal ceramidase [Candidatus Rubidus massiliensis]|nr:Neutral/alkaline non-lysosomal ceramidase [Candidatus Rubidus massiliensis]
MMKKKITFILYVFIALTQTTFANVLVGTAQTNITPPLGTPSAGYAERFNRGMTCVHDPLLANALVIDNGTRKIAFCSVDHLGFNSAMVQSVKEIIQSHPGLETCEIFVSSTHTHSGGGCFFDDPILEKFVTGPFSPEITQLYITQTAQAIIDADKNKESGLIGIGYTQTSDNLSYYRSSWPEDMPPSKDLTIIKVTKLDGSPLAVLFNFALHPTTLDYTNFAFSADFVYFARECIKEKLGKETMVLFINGAQGDIIPLEDGSLTSFALGDFIGKSIANTVVNAWPFIPTNNSLSIATFKDAYDLIPQPNTSGMSLNIDHYFTEINFIVLNGIHSFVTIPGELSCVYYYFLNHFARNLGLHLSVFGLTNDAHGYIITPESFKRKTYESTFSFGGPNYGNVVLEKATRLINIYLNPFAEQALVNPRP